jgi:hypothetical protein
LGHLGSWLARQCEGLRAEDDEGEKCPEEKDALAEAPDEVRDYFIQQIVTTMTVRGLEPFR